MINLVDGSYVEEPFILVRAGEATIVGSISLMVWTVCSVSQ